nr:hypothetical protein [Nostoc sp. EfeVER01]MDZ7948256.1 hypothetical protein [Nostoc sp. EfeVER01]
MCSNAFVQAIALALSGGSAVGGFSDFYTPQGRLPGDWLLPCCSWT